MKVPVSVIVPRLSKRGSWWVKFGLPSIEANDPEQIIQVIDKPTNVARNEGAAQATQPYLFFCDDDTILARNCLAQLVEAIELNGVIPHIGYAYCNYTFLALPPFRHEAWGSAHTHIAGEFEAQRLKGGNFVSTMSLIRRECFPGFDPEIMRLQDWDLFLTMMEKGYTGTYVRETLFYAFQIDQGISSTVPLDEALSKVKRKHGI